MFYNFFSLNIHKLMNHTVRKGRMLEAPQREDPGIGMGWL